MQETAAIAEARRSLEICNACRYCEGYCAVFPAMELRREFTAPDISYLANLCHGCRGCYYACQYAPPHQFGINLPQAFSEIRVESYEHYAWPQPLAQMFRRSGTVVSIAAALGVALVLVLTGLLQNSGVVFAAHTGPGAFYRVIPFEAMVAVASVTFLFALLALAMSVRNFWRAGTPVEKPAKGAFWKAVSDALTLRNLGGGGHGCNDRDGSFSGTRRQLHHTMFYGFLLCFAATSVATIYDHGFGWIAPYSLLSLPVLLGTLGGIGMVVGTVGLIWLKIVGDTEPVARKVVGGEYALLFLLLLVAVTGLLLLALRSTQAMGIALAVHLGFILALFLLLPYSKFVHGLYRAAALLRAAREHT
jgi:citrate/tricarballylate utilization protein